MYGKKHWFFPDAEQPPKGTNPDLPGHESIIVLNPNEVDAEIEVMLHWTDRAPTGPIRFTVKAGCTRCVRCMEGYGFNGEVQVECGEQYAIAVHASCPVIAQYGRLDMRSGPMAFYTTPGYCE